MATIKKCMSCGEQYEASSLFDAFCEKCKKEFNKKVKEVRNFETDENVIKHRVVCTELNSLYSKKNKDYGNSFTKTYEEFGLTMSAIRLNDKLERFKRLIKNDNEVKDESIRDTLIDLANYAIMTVMEMDKNER